jgi:hypothetical protein
LPRAISNALVDNVAFFRLDRVGEKLGLGAFDRAARCDRRCHQPVTDELLSVTNLNDFNGPNQTTNLGEGKGAVLLPSVIPQNAREQTGSNVCNQTRLSAVL